MKNQFRSIFLLFLGVVLGVFPVFAAHIAIRDYVQSRSERFLDQTAESTLVRAESLVQEAIDVFSALHHYSVPVCDNELQDRFRRMMLRHSALHDVGLIYNGEYMYCSSIKESTSFQPTSAEAKGSVPHLSYRAVRDRLTGKDGLLVQWHITEFVSIGGFILVENFVQRAVQTEYDDFYRIGIKLTNDNLLAESTPETRLRKRAPFYSFEPDPSWTKELIERQASSSRYPISVAVAIPFGAAWENFAGVVRVVDGLGVLAGGLIMFLFVRLSLRKPDPYVSLEKAIKRKEFVPYYQPILDIQSGRLSGCEVLVRWRKPDGSITSPGHFIDAAEASGLALPMTASLMEQVAEDLSESYGDRPNLKVAINLFNKHFEDLAIVREVEQVFGNSGVRFEQLVLEVTERQPLENLDRARAIISRLQELGVRVALDDAGTGHGGFAYLQKLGMDIIKIDKLFVDTITADAESVPIIDSLSQMAKGMDMVVVAEGVETDEQLDYLRRIGIDEAQGFLFSPALPASAYLKLVAALGNKKQKQKDDAPSAEGKPVSKVS
nr:EAL domain-containing protein [uncultured Cohaesibacter sp.]